MYKKHYSSPNVFACSQTFRKSCLFIRAVFLTYMMLFVITACGSGAVGISSGSLQISPGNLDFGDVGLGQSVKKTISLSSTGRFALSISKVNLPSSVFSLASDQAFPLSIPAGKTQPISIAFTPSAAQDYTAQVAFIDSSSNTLGQIATRGRGQNEVSPTSQISANMNTVDFGEVVVDTAATQTISLTASGTAVVTVDSAAISGTGFTLAGGTLPATLNPGQSVALTVQFKPTAAGSVSGQLDIHSNASSGNTRITLHGRASSPAYPKLALSAESLDFGDVTVNIVTTRLLTLSSTGTLPVTINSVNIGGNGFSLVSGVFPVTLNPGQSMTLRVQFKPTVTGSAAGRLAISSTVSSGAMVLPLSGLAVAPNPQLTLSAGSLSFGSVTVGTSTTQSLILSSTGTSPVTVNTIGVSGAGFVLVPGRLPAVLNPGQSMTLRVQFSPVTTGPSIGRLTINSNASPATDTVVLNGSSTVVPIPQLTLSNASLTFGSVTVNTSSTQSLTLRSTGTAPVVIASTTLNGSGFAVTGGALPATLNPGQSMTLQISFTPTVTGAATGQITINSNSSPGAATVVLAGSGIAAPVPQLTVSTASLAFGNVTVKTSAAQSLTLRSTGTASVTVNSVTITGAGFALVGSPLPATLSPGQSITLQVQFSPTATGAATGQITINSTSSAGAATVVLSGSGIAVPVPQLTVSSTNLSFGSITIDSSTTQTLVLRSSGTATVTVNSAVITGGMFSVVAQSFPISLAAGQSVTLQIQFSPTTAGTATGQLTISSNSTGNNITTVALSGMATAANPQLAVNSSTLSFGSVALNTPISKTLTLTSTGTSTVTISAATVGGTGFTLVGGSFPLSLTPGKSATLQLQFLPTTSGARSGQVTIVSNSAGGNLTVALNGTGTGGASEVDLSWDAPSNSPVPVVGYNIYRSIGTTDGFSVLNSSPVAAVVFADKTITNGTTYAYIVKSVDATGTESTPSNQITMAIP